MKRGLWFFLKLLLIGALVAPFSIGSNTLRVTWWNQDYAIDLAVAVFIIVCLFMILHAVLMQVHDVRTSWRQFRTNRMETRLLRAGNEVQQLLSHSVRGIASPQETKRLSRVLKDKDLVVWGDLLSAITQLERWDQEQSNPSKSERQKVCRKAMQKYNKLKDNGAFASERIAAQILWRIAKESHQQDLIDQALAVLSEHDADHPELCLVHFHQALAERSYDAATACLENHTMTLHPRIATAWLALARQAHQEGEALWQHAKKHLPKKGKEEAEKSKALLVAQQHPDERVRLFLKHAKSCDPSIVDSSVYLIILIALTTRENNMRQAQTLCRNNALTIADSFEGANLWLRTHVDSAKSKSTTAKNVLMHLESWCSLTKDNPRSKYAVLRHCLDSGYVQKTQECLEHLLRKPMIDATLQAELAGILVQAGQDYTPYLKQLYQSHDERLPS